MKCPICNKETWNCNPVRWGPEFAHRECVARIGPQPFAGPDWPEGPLQDDDWAGEDAPDFWTPADLVWFDVDESVKNPTIGPVWCSCEECRPEWHYGREEPDAPYFDPLRLSFFATELLRRDIAKFESWTCCTNDDHQRYLHALRALKRINTHITEQMCDPERIKRRIAASHFYEGLPL